MLFENIWGYNNMGTELKGKEKIKDFIDEISLAWRGGHWNYRVIEKSNGYYIYYEIHEVYYDKNEEIIAWTENPVDLYFEDFRSLKLLTKRFKKAGRKTILKIENDDLIDTGKYLKKRD